MAVPFWGGHFGGGGVFSVCFLRNNRTCRGIGSRDAQDPIQLRLLSVFFMNFAGGGRKNPPTSTLESSHHACRMGTKKNIAVTHCLPYLMQYDPKSWDGVF